MFESILKEVTEQTTTLTGLDIGNVLEIIIAAIIIGLAVSITYVFVSKKKNLSHNLCMTLIIMPAIIAVMILMIGSNVATAFSLAGICTLVRFRSLPGDSKDITFIFLAVTSGLAAGMGYITYAAMFTAVILLVIVIYTLLIAAGESDESVKVLRITIPEDLNFQDAFDDIFEKYTTSARLDKAKTINLGTLFELTYTIREKKNINEKEFIDSIRERNGNLNIMLMRSVPDNERL